MGGIILKQIIFFLVFSINIFAYDLYVGAGVASEIDSKMDSSYYAVKYPSVFLLDAEISHRNKYFDIGFGVSLESNCSYTSYEGIQDGRKYDVISPYGLIRAKIPTKLITPFVALKYGICPIVINRDNTDLGGLGFFRSSIGVFYKKFQIECSYGGAVLVYNDVPEDALLPITGEFNYALTIKKNIK